MTTPKPDFEGFTKAIMEDWQEHCDIDAADKFEWALKFNILRKIPGGFDPKQHEDVYFGEAEPGDPWYESNY